MGRDTICVPVSALTGEGIDNLLEMILLLSEMLELSKSNKLASGVIIEAEWIKARALLRLFSFRAGH